jgi:hypothetical protein
MHVAFIIPYVYEHVTELCIKQAEVLLNDVNPNLRGIGQGEVVCKKYKRLKLGGDKAYDLSSV